MRRHTILTVTLLCVLGSHQSYGDLVVYAVPNTGMAVTLQGETKVNPGRTVTFTHPRFGKAYFALSDCVIHDLPSTRSLAERRLKTATASRSADKVLEAGKWALHHGHLKQFYKAASAAWKLDPNHATVQRLIKLKRLMDAPLSEPKRVEQELRKFCKMPDMKVATSKHFILLHDTPDPKSKRMKSRAQERLDLLETVYESFLIKFYLEGLQLNVPRERLKVILFSRHEDYLRFVQLISPTLSKASGFWTRVDNISVFYDQGTDKAFDSLLELNKQLQTLKDSAKKNRSANARDIVRMADAINLVTQITRKNLDIEVVTHEVTHQMAGNTGLLRRELPIPRWVAEGLATYFEAPKSAAWSGIGTVNKDRLEMYRLLERDTEHSNIDFIVSDKIFTYARTHNASLHGYGQAWALTHFLMEKKFGQFMQWYGKINKMTPKQLIKDENLTSSFRSVFGSNVSGLDREWRLYMRSLKTDMELLLE